MRTRRSLFQSCCSAAIAAPPTWANGSTRWNERCRTPNAWFWAGPCGECVRPRQARRRDLRACRPGPALNVSPRGLDTAAYGGVDRWQTERLGRQRNMSHRAGARTCARAMIHLMQHTAPTGNPSFSFPPYSSRYAAAHRSSRKLFSCARMRRRPGRAEGDHPDSLSPPLMRAALHALIPSIGSKDRFCGSAIETTPPSE
jgi:hypothetical protein